MKPRLAFVPGDPSGIGPELIAKLIHANVDDLPANILLVGDKHLWDQGAKQANLRLSFNTITEGEVSTFEGIAHLDLNTIDPNMVKIAQNGPKNLKTQSQKICLSKWPQKGMNITLCKAREVSE